MVSAISAFAFSFVPFVAWIFASDALFKSLQSTGYWPWPAASAGMILGYLANVFLFFNLYFGVYRIYGSFAQPQKSEPEEPEVYAPAMGPPGAFGVPPGEFGGPPGFAGGM